MAKAVKQKVKKGNLVRVTGNSNSNDYTVGEVYRVITGVEASSKTFQAETLDGNWRGNHLHIDDVVVVGLTRDYYENVIRELEAEIAETKARLKWMEETSNVEFDDNEFRAWTALTTLEDPKLSKMEKAKVLASLIKG